MTAPKHKPSTALGWYPHNATTEAATMDMANSRQFALRSRLRDHYWLTECKPIGTTTLDLTRKKMALIDKKDRMTDAEVAEVLTDHYGFKATPDGLTIPDLDEARGIAVGSLLAIQERASKGGIAKAKSAAARKEAVPPKDDPTDF